jgi:hypothetical protein
MLAITWMPISVPSSRPEVAGAVTAGVAGAVTAGVAGAVTAGVAGAVTAGVTGTRPGSAANRKAVARPATIHVGSDATGTGHHPRGR